MEAIMPRSATTRLVIGAVIALGMEIVSVSAIRGAAAVEQTPVNRPQALDNRDDPLISETDAPVSDREQLRRYFLEDWRDRLRR
jgi:hypothetical protein